MLVDFHIPIAFGVTVQVSLPVYGSLRLYSFIYALRGPLVFLCSLSSKVNWKAAGP